MIDIGTNGSIAILISLAAASGLSTLVGFVLAVRFSRSRKGIAVGIGFSVGIMVVISIFELLPAALDALAPMNALLSATGGAMLVALFHWVIPHQHLVKEHGMLGARLAKTSYLVALGMILHDVPEGFALANVYLAEPSVGVMLAIAIALHNIPEGFVIGVPAAQLKNRRLLTEVAAASVLAEPLGVCLGLWALHLYPQFDGYLMALAAGAMVYVSLHELLPMAKEQGDLHMLEVGMVLSAIAYAAMAWLFTS